MTMKDSITHAYNMYNNWIYFIFRYNLTFNNMENWYEYCESDCIHMNSSLNVIYGGFNEYCNWLWKYESKRLCSNQLGIYKSFTAWNNYTVLDISIFEVAFSPPRKKFFWCFSPQKNGEVAERHLKILKRWQQHSYFE